MIGAATTTADFKNETSVLSLKTFTNKSGIHATGAVLLIINSTEIKIVNTAVLLLNSSFNFK